MHNRAGSGNFTHENTKFRKPLNLKYSRFKIGGQTIAEIDHTDEFSEVEIYKTLPNRFAAVEPDQIDLITSRDFYSVTKPWRRWGLNAQLTDRFFVTFSLRRIAPFLIGRDSASVSFELGFSSPTPGPVALCLFGETRGALSFIRHPLAVVNSVVE